MITSCSFKLAHYRSCLEDALARGYRIMTLDAYVHERSSLAAEQKIIVLRHDVDHYLSLALQFADIEHALGIASTYFIRLHARYNAMGYEGYECIQSLKKMGHEIGLHYDADFSSLFGEDQLAFFARDKRIMEAILDQPIAGISAHEPRNANLQITDAHLNTLGLTYQAYSPIFMEELKYISDSSARWREGCMCAFISSENPRLCILTHPLWWHEKSPLQNY